MIQGCEVCENNAAKYKCPKCNIPFCSVECSQTHKVSSNCSSEQDLSGQDVTTKDGEESSNEWHTHNTVPSEILQKLGTSSKLREILKNKDLQNLLKLIDKSIEPQNVYTEALKDPAFDEFVQLCLSVVQPENNS